MNFQLKDDLYQSTQIQERFNKELDLAVRLLRIWRDVGKQWRKSRLDLACKGVAVFLSTQGFRRLRSIVELCKRCEAEDAIILSRSLFENLVATEFVFKKRLALRLQLRGPDHDNPDRGDCYKVKPVKGKPRNSDLLSNAFRAKLLSAHNALQDAILENKLRQQPGVKRIGRAIGKKLPEHVRSDIKRVIGPRWYSVLTFSPFTYSGLNIDKLCGYLGGTIWRWHKTLYSIQSRDVHGANLFKYGDSDENEILLPKLYSDDGQIYLALYAGTSLFLELIERLHESVGLGIAIWTSIRSLVAEAREVYSNN